MPTRKPRIWLTVSEEERRELFVLWTELRKPGRRRAPEYIGQKLTFNQWLKGLTAEGAERTRRALAAASAALTTGMVKEPMTTKPSTKKSSKPPKPSESPAEERPARGRPRGTYKENLTLSLDKDIITFLKEQPAGPSATANAILRRSLRRRKSPQ